MYCIRCGTHLNEGSAFCPRCGAQVAPTAGAPAEEVSQKSRLAVTLLSCPVLYVGLFGVHRFYTGKIWTAVIMLLMALVPLVCAAGIMAFVFATNGFENRESPPLLFFVLYGLAFVSYFAVFIWSLVDFIIAVTGNFKDSQGKPISKW